MRCNFVGDKRLPEKDVYFQVNCFLLSCHGLKVSQRKRQMSSEFCTDIFIGFTDIYTVGCCWASQNSFLCTVATVFFMYCTVATVFVIYVL